MSNCEKTVPRIPIGELKENPYSISESVRKIAEGILNDTTKLCNIEYLFVDKKTFYAGKISKCSKEVNLITGLNYIMFINMEIWGVLNDFKREALVFHELEHIEWKPNIKDPNFGAWALKRHDLEEFNSVVRKYGRWSPDVINFERSINTTINPEVLVDTEGMEGTSGKVIPLMTAEQAFL